MDKIAFILSYLANIQESREESMSPHEMKSVLKRVAKKFKSRPPKIVYGGEDFYDPLKNILSASGSKPAFYHELGHYILQKSKKGRVIERAADFGEKMMFPTAVIAPPAYIALKRFMRPKRALLASLALPAAATIPQLVDEFLATHFGTKYSPENIKRKMQLQGVLPTLTYAEPLLASGLGVAGIGLARRLLHKFKKSRRFRL